jgi:uncharacterized protein YqfA (UPF0365 family)
MNAHPATFVLVGLFVVAAVVMMLRYVKLYVGAWVAGAPVSMTELVGMKLRGVDPATVVYARVQLAREGIELPAAELQTLALAGGNVARVVNAMVIARRGNVELPWVKAMAIELAGWDVLAAARGASDAEIKAGWKNPMRPDSAK